MNQSLTLPLCQQVPKGVGHVNIQLLILIVIIVILITIIVTTVIIIILLHVVLIIGGGLALAMRTRSGIILIRHTCLII